MEIRTFPFAGATKRGNFFLVHIMDTDHPPIKIVYLSVDLAVRAMGSGDQLKTGQIVARSIPFKVPSLN